MIKAGMLFRVSSQGQEDGYSLQDQEHDCREYATKQGYHVDDVHVWNDGAQKSWTLNRPGLQAAIKAIRNGEINTLIVGRYDRFSRVQMQQAVAIYEIEQIHGGQVESANPREQFGRDSTGVLLRSINAWRAEQELDLIRDRTQSGRRARAQSGKLIASPYPLYGYLWADAHDRRGKSRYVIDPEATPIIERIYRDIASGEKVRTLARKLTLEGIPTPGTLLVNRGLATPTRFKNTGEWSVTMIRRILRNPAYCGQYVAYRTHTRTGQGRTADGQMKVQSHTILRHEDDPSRVVLSPDVCPAIISTELYAQVRQQMEINAKDATRNLSHVDNYLLRSGLAVCGYCGKNMTVNTSGRVGKKTDTYRCCQSAGSIINRCLGKNFLITSSVLDKAVWAAIVYLFSDPHRIRTILATQLTERDEGDTREEDHKKAVEGQLQHVTLQIDNATRAVLNATNEQTHAIWSQQLEHLLPEKEALERALTDVKEGNRRRRAAYDYLSTIEEWCQMLGAEILDASYEEKRFLLRGLKTKVTCYRTDHEPRYTIEWDLARLHEPLRNLLPNLTDQDVTRIYELNNTYFRSQTSDYQPGTGFVPVKAGIA